MNQQCHRKSELIPSAETVPIDDFASRILQELQRHPLTDHTALTDFSQPTAKVQLAAATHREPRDTDTSSES